MIRAEIYRSFKRQDDRMYGVPQQYTKSYGMNASVHFTLNATISVVMNAVAMKRKQKVAFFLVYN